MRSPDGSCRPTISELCSGMLFRLATLIFPLFDCISFVLQQAHGQLCGSFDGYYNNEMSRVNPLVANILSPNLP